MELTNINDIKQLLHRHGFRFSKSLGQNFLVASWVPEDIADSADIDGGTGVLEIGPGIGCLTEQLSMRARKVVSIELDNALRPVLAETLGGRENVEIVFGDALKLDIAALVNEKMPDMYRVVCANLPYNVTTPIISKLLECGEFETITVMIQREVARRICAAAGTADYGAFTVFVNWYAQPEMLFDVPAGCFIPQPKVTSSVIRLKRRDTPPVQVKSETVFFRVVRAAFAQRRKTLVNALSAGFGELSKESIEKCIIDSGFDAKIRGEVLSIGDFAKIADAFCTVSE